MTAPEDIDAMRDARDVAGLIRALDDADEFIRAQAALSLGTIADPKTREPLDRMQKEDPSISAHETAAIAYK